jgi:hypothetical protein
MSDWRSSAITVASDPLAGNFLVIAIGALVSRLLFAQHPTWRSRANSRGELSHALAERQAAGRTLASAGVNRGDPHGGLGNWFFSHTQISRDRGFELSMRARPGKRADEGFR